MSNSIFAKDPGVHNYWRQQPCYVNVYKRHPTGIKYGEKRRSPYPTGSAIYRIKVTLK